MTTNPQTSEAKEALIIQIKMMNASAIAYDAGERWEAARIAASIHTIVHDMAKRKPSVLSRLGVKSTMKFLASGPPINPRNLVSSAPLTIMRINSGVGAEPLPRLSNGPPIPVRWIGFNKWWEDDPIFSGGSYKHLVTRKSLTFGLRNKDGGSHYDPNNRDVNYSRMADGSWILTDGKTETKVRGEELATMRQVAWELLESLRMAALII